VTTTGADQVRPPSTERFTMTEFFVSTVRLSPSHTPCFAS